MNSWGFAAFLGGVSSLTYSRACRSIVGGNLEQYIDPEFLEARLAEITVWVQDHIFVLSAVIQFAVIAFAFLIAWFTAGRFEKMLEKGWDYPLYERFGKPAAQALAPLSLPVIWLALQWFSVFAAENAKLRERLTS